MADPRKYTDFNSCIRPMISNGLITGYRRIVLDALVRHAAKERTIVDLSVKPFGLRVRHGTASEEPAARPVPAGTLDTIDQVCSKYPFLAQYKKTIRDVAAAIADGDAMLRTVGFTPRTRVMRMKLASKMLTMHQLVGLHAVPHATNIIIVNNPVPYIEFTVGNERRSTYEWPPRRAINE